ncbi:MAG: ATP-binding protein [Lachnospiraceae bacterium]|nr:ATP-binding protein [Lachnospiraceae bacterium]
MQAQIFAWMMDLFFIFTLHILFEQLLGVKYQNRLALLVGWGLCFVLWNVSSYLTIENAFVSNVSTSMIYFLVLYFLYNGNVRNKLILMILVVTLGIIAEGIVAFALTISGVPADEYLSRQPGLLYIGNAFSKLVWFAFVKLITRISLKQKQMKTRGMDWFEIFLVPIGSILICYVIWWGRWRHIDLAQIIVLGVLLVINLVTYYMYQRVQEHAAERMENELLKQQNAFFCLRYEELEKQWLKLRRMRHDMANHYALEMSYLKKGEYEHLMQHYEEKLGQIKQQGNVIHTGNIGIDSILNYKLEIAREYGIAVDKEIKIESEIVINHIDLNILIGNLFDNAIEAVKELPADKKKIHFSIKTNAARLLFGIRNAYEGKKKRDSNGDFLTSKRDDFYHGLGLKEAKEIVKKYDGQMNISDSHGEFSVKVFLYIKG